MSPQEKQFFLDRGYLHVAGVVVGDHLRLIQSEFDRVWDLEGPPVGSRKLLQHAAFLDLIEHPPILNLHRAFFGRATQLLQLDLLRQGPHSDSPERSWHRDFTHPGDHPLSINTILYLDDMNDSTGPTRVVPGTHRGLAMPPDDRINESLPGEVEVYAAAGDAVFINSAIWHSGGRNRGPGLRRGIYLYYGYWWLRPYRDVQPDKYALPWQAMEGASVQRLELLGLRFPLSDLHMYRRSEVGAEQSEGAGQGGPHSCVDQPVRTQSRVT